MLLRIYYATIIFKLLDLNNLIDTLRNTCFMFSLLLPEFLLSGKSTLQPVNPWSKSIRETFDKYLINKNSTLNNCFVLTSRKRSDL
jgi:hypothetical protein